MNPPHRIREIAVQAGLSQATVDRVLHERGGVRESTVREVHRAIAELDRRASQSRATGPTVRIDVVAATAEVRAALEAELPSLLPIVIRPRFVLSLDQVRGTQGVILHLSGDLTDESGKGGVASGRLESGTDRSGEGPAPAVSGGPVAEAVAGTGPAAEAVTAGGPAAEVVAGSGSAAEAIVAGDLAAEAIAGSGPAAAAGGDPVAELVAGLGVPVVTLGTDLAESKRVAHVGIDPAVAGATAAYLVEQWLADRAGSVLMAGPGDRRAAGFRDEMLVRAPHRRLIEAGTPAGIRAVLDEHPAVRAVHSLLPAGNRAIIDGLASAHRNYDVFVAHGLTAENRELLRTREISAVLHHDLRADLRHACRAILQALGTLPGPVRDEPSAIQVITPFTIPAEDF